MTLSITSTTNDRAAVGAKVETTVPHYPARPGIPLGISAEQLQAAQRVLEAEINKARSGQPSAASDTRG